MRCEIKTYKHNIIVTHAQSIRLTFPSLMYMLMSNRLLEFGIIITVFPIKVYHRIYTGFHELFI